MRGRFRFGAAIIAALLVPLFAVSAYAQFTTGNMFGRTVAKDGSALPGVTVTLTGVGAPRTAVTDAQGNFRFANLDPGMYTLRAELAGFGTATRAGVNVGVGQTADVTMTLNPTVAEAITVTADAPLLDVRKAGTGASVSKVELENIPTARDPWMILQTTPGVMVDRINVGGTQSGQQSVYLGKGSRGAAGNIGSDNSWNVDGVNITDMGATGSSPTYYDFDTFEEMQITTGGSDPRIKTAGVQLNMVTKRGTNDFKGSGRYLYVPGSTSADASVPDEAFYLSLTNRVNYVRDYGAELGGPILRDRLWLWLARGDQKISTWQSLSAPPPPIYIPDDTILRNKNAKLNAQIMSANSFVGSFTEGDKFRNARDIGFFRPYEASWKQTGPTKVYKLEDTHIFGSSFYLTGMWSKVDGGFGLFANGGAEGASSPAAWVNNLGQWQQNYLTYQTIRPQKQYRADGSTFFNLGNMNHELKFGYGYRDTPVHSTTVWPGPAFGYWNYASTANTPALCTAQGLPTNCAHATLVRPPVRAYDEDYRELYLGDTIQWGDLTLQVGLRWDEQISRITGVDVGPNPILATPLDLPCRTGLTCPGGTGRLAAQLPGINYPGQDRDTEWSSIAPRIGATYALGADKRTLLRAAYNRYVSQMGSLISTSSPLSYSFFSLFGVDQNNDRTIQRNELTHINGWGGINPLAPTSLTSVRRIDYDMEVPTTDEFVIGFDRELFANFALGFAYTYRRYDNFVAFRYEKTQGAGDYYTAADFVQTGRNAGGTFTQCLVTVPAGQTCPSGQSRTVTTPAVPVFDLRPGVPTPTFSVITTRPDYHQTYNGLELTATKRMSNRWMMRANFSWNDHKEHCDGDSFANPTPVVYTLGAANIAGAAACRGGQVSPQSAASGDFQNVFINSKWNFNLNGLFVAPWGINIGANLISRQGYPAVVRDRITSAVPAGAPAGTAAAPLRTGTIDVVLDPFGDRRFDTVYQLDVRVAKDFNIFRRVTFTPSVDVFNATNQRTILQRNTLLMQNNVSLPAGWRITEMQAPRVLRFGGKISF